MLNIDFLTLKAFFIENIDFIIGARVQKIQQPTRRDLIFSLRNNFKSKKLYINIFPQIYHICFMSEENEKRRIFNIPKHPPMFCMLLRKYIEGCRIEDCKVIENERIIEFHFETMDELSEKRSLCLCVELMGKHSNIILYDRINSTIIGCAHNVGAEKSRYRELQGGIKYVYPPNTGLELHFSKELEKEFINLTNEEINKYLTKETFNPAINNDRYTLFSELLPHSIKVENVNILLDNYYSYYQEKMIIDNEKNRLSNIITPKLKKVTNSISKISQLLKQRDYSDKYKLYGELLTANTYQKKDYKSKIELYDYINNTNIEIELDNSKTMIENAQNYFRLYTKSKTTKEKSITMLNNLNIEKEYYENILYSIGESSNIDEINDIATEIEPNNNIKPNKLSENSIKKIIINDYEIFIGRNNKQNDYIVSRLAKDNDYWFHTRLCAGSHVLLKTNGKEPDDEIILKCCKLARNFSSAHQPSKVGIIYTLAKNLKKPPKSPLGYVIYKNEKEILI